MTDIQEEKVDEIKRSLDRVYFYTDTVDCVAITGSKNGVLVTYHIYSNGWVTKKEASGETLLLLIIIYKGIEYEYKYNKTFS